MTVEPKTERAIDMLQMAIEYGEACSGDRRWVPSALQAAREPVARALPLPGAPVKRAAFAGVVLGVALSCGGETTGAAPAPAQSTCRDEAHRETDVDDVACDEGARIEIVDGWIVCRCGP